jgi:hypothetical protein
MIKKGIIVIAVILLVITGAIAIGTFALYKNQKHITQMAIKKINENFEGILVVEDSYISPFANFPYISIDLHHVKFFDNKDREGKPLYEIEDLYLGFDILEIFEGNYNVKSLKISGGHLDIIQYENGDINVMLAKGLNREKEKEEEQEEADFHFELKEVSLYNFIVSKHNIATGQHYDINIGMAQANFRKAKDHVFIFLDTEFILDIMDKDENYIFENKHMEIHGTLDFDEVTHMLKIEPSRLHIEKALFTMEGLIDVDDDLNLDLKITGHKPNFNVFAALAPKEVGEQLARYQNEGKIYFNGLIQGKAAPGYSPLITVDFGCQNAYFLNKDVNKKVDELQFKGFFTNGEGRSLETSEFRLENFHAKPDEGIFTGNFYVRNFADPYIAINMRADIDFQFLAQFFGIEGLRRLKGQILLDMNFDELVDMDKPETSLARLKEGIDSEMTIKNLSFLIPGYPHEIQNVNGHADMENGMVKFDSLTFRIGESDFYFDATLNDFPAIFHKQSKPIKFTLNSKSQKINFAQLLEFDPELAEITNEELTDFKISLAFETSVDNLLNADPLPKGEFFINDFYGKLKNYPHHFHDFDVDIIVDDKNLSIKNFHGEIDDTDFDFTGIVKNYHLWFEENKKGDTEIEFDLTSKQIRVNDLLTYQGENYLPEDYREEVIQNLKLHGRVELHYDSLLTSTDFYLDQFTARLKVHPLKMEKFKGRAHYENEHLLLESFGGIMGNSDFKINMNFYTGEDAKRKKKDNYFHIASKVLDLDQLMNYEEPKQDEEVNHEEAFNIFTLPFTDIKLSADIGKIRYHKIFLNDFHADMRLQEDHFLYIDSLFMKTAGGSMSMNGYFNGSNPEKIYFNSKLTANNLDLDQLLFKFDNFGQDYMVNENLKGQVSGLITSTFRMHPDLTFIMEESDATMNLMIKNGSVINFAPLQAMATYFKDKNLNRIRFDTLQNNMTLKNGVIHIPTMNINSSLGYIEMSGTQSLDTSMEYFVRVPWKLVGQAGASALFNRKNREEVDPEQEDEIIYRDTNKRTRFLNLKISGNSEDFTITLGKDKRKNT